ncbi:hypothetical protein [uncultured Helicobacter sp.]|uniref:hypothetical protein n=1 Tax=uncultured Helicobacter sp. TaxID=175537 RepID=UPI00261AA3E2|nr:hypothetical protein [uncultured Helicobacter sp.]
MSVTSNVRSLKKPQTEPRELIRRQILTFLESSSRNTDTQKSLRLAQKSFSNRLAMYKERRVIQVNLL